MTADARGVRDEIGKNAEQDLHLLAGRNSAGNTWAQRRLESIYAAVFIDSLSVRVRENALLCRKPIHIALGILPDGSKDVIAFWVGDLESKHHWLSAFFELHQRGVAHLHLAVIEDVPGCLAAFHDIFPNAAVFTSVKCFIRQALEQVPPNQRPAVAAELRKAFENATDSSAALCALGPSMREYPKIAAYLREHGTTVSDFFNCPPAIRSLISSNSAVESVIEKLRRRGLSKRGSYPSSETAVRELIAALQDANASWKVSPNKWLPVKLELALISEVKLT